MRERTRNATRTLLRRLLAQEAPLTWAEGAVCLAVLAAVSAAVYGPQVAHGNFYSDDWANSSVYRYSPEPRFFHAFDKYWSNLGGRPLLAVFLAVPHAVFGTDPKPHIALGVVLATLTCFAFYLLLRQLRLARLHAGLVALLALLFPWSDSTRLWATGSINTLAVMFYLFGTALALDGLRRTPRLVTVRQAAALCLVVVGVLTYEAVGAAALLSVGLYLFVAPPGVALRRWAVDLVVVGDVLLVLAKKTESVRGLVGARTTVAHIPGYAHGAGSILELSFRPLGAPWWVLVLALAIIGAVLSQWASFPAPAREQVRRWGLVAAAAAVGVAVAYAFFLGYELFPQRRGMYNRGNLIAALPFALLIYALAMAAGSALFASVRRWQAWSLAFSLCAVLIVGIGYLDRLSADKRQWRRAAAMETHAVAVLKWVLPHPPAGSTIYTFNYPAQVAPGVPIFSDTWDLRGAVRINWNDHSLAAYPIITGTHFVCGPRGTHPVGGKEYYFLELGYGPEQGGSYGRVFAVDLRTREIHRIDSQRACATILRRMKPGIRYLEDPASA